MDHASFFSEATLIEIGLYEVRKQPTLELLTHSHFNSD